MTYQSDGTCRLMKEVFSAIVTSLRINMTSFWIRDNFFCGDAIHWLFRLECVQRVSTLDDPGS